MNPIRFLCCAIVVAGLAGRAQAAVTAQLDRDRIGSGDTVVLTLRRDGSASGAPNLAPLARDFDILGRSRSTNVEVVNGHMTSHSDLRLTLSPKRNGQLRIPPIAWGGEKSAPLQLTVVGGGAAAGPPASRGGTASPSAHVFLTSSLQSADPYVQAADVLTVRVYTDEPLQQASLDLPANDNVVVQRLGKDRQSTELRNGRRYHVTERRYLLVPQHSGAIKLDGPVLDAQVIEAGSGNPLGDGSLFKYMFGRDPFAGMMQVTRPIRVHGDAIALSVRPRPAQATGSDWVPAQSVALSESLEPGGAIHAGEPATLHLHVSALGVPAATLPDLSARLALPAGLKAYPDKAKLATRAQGDTVAGSRDQDIALIADHAGHYELPAVRLDWWDTNNASARVAEVPARGFDVLAPAGGAPQSAAPAAPARASAPAAPAAAPAATTTAAATPAAPDALAPPARPATRVPQGETGRTWRWLSFALGALWVATIAVWWLSRRRAAGSPAPAVAPEERHESETPAEAFKAFRRACREHDAPAARRHLLDWARAVWTEDPPAGLISLAQRLGDPRLKPLLQDLDRACYAGTEWRGEALAQTLQPPERRRAPKAGALAELYPS